MRNIYLALAAAALASCARPATKVKIPYNVDRVEISASYPDSALYSSTLTYLDQEGYVVQRSDEKQGTIVTDYKALTNAPYAVRLLVNAKGQKITFRGQGEGQVLGTRAQGVELNNNVRTSLGQRKGFRKVDELARRLSRRLPGSSYTYKNGNIYIRGQKK